ncbi:TfoX/Sxy family DNA transformation protein [Vibrio sonorensis]|uniref:TfoX/Sxy family DNA transformation protein n=1 Tax=Vibrio sonorensis TaxID=1004316 RepID=UPI0008D8D661|nr:TfoX/Sxy family DNA transformation protein [Vibrio sonorensis]
MDQNRALVELVNIGDKLASRLQEVGINNEQDLKFYGAVEAHKRLCSLYPNETLAVCYYLYSFDGAISDTNWRDLSKERKKKLLNQLL